MGGRRSRPLWWMVERGTRDDQCPSQRGERGSGEYRRVRIRPRCTTTRQGTGDADDGVQQKLPANPKRHPRGRVTNGRAPPPRRQDGCDTRAPSHLVTDNKGPRGREWQVRAPHVWATAGLEPAPRDSCGGLTVRRRRRGRNRNAGPVADAQTGRGPRPVMRAAAQAPADVRWSPQGRHPQASSRAARGQDTAMYDAPCCSPRQYN